jgi:hypothetical protein
MQADKQTPEADFKYRVVFTGVQATPSGVSLGKASSFPTAPKAATLRVYGVAPSLAALDWQRFGTADELQLALA